MRVITLSLLLAILTFVHAKSPIPLLTEEAIFEKAMQTGLSSATAIGYDQREHTHFYPGGATYVRDLVNIHPNDYGQLYAEVFHLQEIKQVNLLDQFPKNSWKAVFRSWPLSMSTEAIVNDIVAHYSGYYEVPIYHDQEGCAMHVRFMAAEKSNWQAAELCPEQPMLSPLEVQQITGLTGEPILVTFEHTDTGWGKMWLIGSVAVHPYNGEVYIVTTRDGIIVDPLVTNIPLEYSSSAKLGRYGPIAERTYNLPIQLRPLGYR